MQLKWKVGKQMQQCNRYINL